MAAIYTHEREAGAYAAMPGLTTLTHFSAAFFTLTLLTDFFYTQTMLVMWQDFSTWLLFFGLIAGGLAVVLWLIGLVMRRIRLAWGGVVLQAVVLVMAFVNSLIHAGDGWTAIVPWGIGVSAVTCLLMLIAAFLNHRGTRVASY